MTAPQLAAGPLAFGGDRDGSLYDGTAAPIVPSRVHLPPLRPGLITRHGVLARLDATEGSPLITLVAPPGYGKTTVLAQWLEHRHGPSGVLVLDKGMNEPAVFVTHLAYALEGWIEHDPDVWSALRKPSRRVRENVIARLASSVADSATPGVLAIDDVHLLDDEESLGMLQMILDNSGNAQVILAARSGLSLPLARLRVRQEISELGPAELRMDAAEVRAVIASAGADVTIAASKRLAEHSEGWPVVAYLAAHVVKQGGDLGEFGGEDWGIAEYLQTEFLDHQSQEVRDFLLDTSVLREISGPLCDAVLLRSGSSALIDSIEKSSLLVVPLDRQRRWFRAHRLLREMLVAEAERRAPERIREIRLRASRWSEAHQEVERAVRYAQEANDTDAVADLVLKNGMRFFAAGRVEVLDPWFDWLWNSGCRDAGVASMCAWLHLARGTTARAHWCLAIAEEGDPRSLLPDGSCVGAWTRSLRAAMAESAEIMRGESTASLDLVGQTAPLRPTVLTLLGFANYMQGSLDEAEALLREAVELCDHLGTSGSGISGRAGLAMLAVERGRWDEVSQLVESANILIETSGIEEFMGSALVRGVSAQLAMRRGDTAAALREVAEAENLLRFVADDVAVFAVAVRVLNSRTLIDAGDLAAAAAVIAVLDTLVGDESAFPMAAQWLGALHTRLAEVQGQHGNTALSPAELRLAPWLATQFTYPDIAERLFVSVHTVKAQVTSIYRKLGVTSRTQAVERMRQLGLIDR